MARPWYERRCVVEDIRLQVEARLKLPPPKDRYVRETPSAFWERVERAGLLSDALALYDQLATDRAVWAHVRRETKREFADRIEREGRKAEAERVLAELLASGLSPREAQEELVQRLQPLDGSQTRAWPTPDPWVAGRLFRSKADYKRWLAQANPEDDLDRDEANDRVNYARHRWQERLALATARRRARALKASAPAPITSAIGSNR